METEIAHTRFNLFQKPYSSSNDFIISSLTKCGHCTEILDSRIRLRIVSSSYKQL